MAGPPAAHPHRGAAFGRNVLLATKLYLPRLQPGFLARPRLTEGLDEGLARGLVLVCAPAGFGKTALLADWARQGRRPVAWLSLDQGDNDPARFWRHVIAALDRMRPGDRRAARSAARPAVPADLRGAGDGPDQRPGRPARCGRDAAGPGRLPPDRRPAGARLARIPAGAPAGGPAAGAGQPG